MIARSCCRTVTPDAGCVARTCGFRFYGVAFNVITRRLCEGEIMENNKSSSIITNHVIFSLVAGTIPIPLADIAAVTAIQLDMIKQIAKIYSIDYDEHAGTSFASALAGASFARMGASLVKMIPGVGTIIGIGTQAVLSGASTYALGNIFERHFSLGGTLLNFDVDKVKSAYHSLVERGKEYAKKIRKDLNKDDVFRTLEKLKELKESGSITEQEFEATKKKLLDKVGE
jgi:uncharacterized protein (DUF697 family)